MSGVADSREATAGTGTNLWEFPLGALFHDARTQVIYLPEDLGGPGRINGLALNLSAVPGQTLSNWTIRLKHTTLTAYLQATWETEGWTTVLRGDEAILASGWVTFLFTTSFEYDGASSLLVDFSFDNATYSVNGLVRSTPTTERRSVYFQTDSAFGDPMKWSGSTAPPPSMLARIPNTRFVFESPVSMTPSGTVHFAGGVWTGAIRVLQPVTNMFLRASDGAGQIAIGNLFDVADAQDTDADGLPDHWEMRHLGSIGASPTEDSDGDGSDNREEFLAGTNPSDAASANAIHSVRMSGADVVIRFPGLHGRAYRLERTESLSQPSWQAVAERVPGVGGTMEIIDRAAATGRSQFYRITVVP